MMATCRNHQTCTRFERGVHCRPHTFPCFDAEGTEEHNETTRLRAENAKLRDQAKRDQRAIEGAYLVQQRLRDRAERAEAEKQDILDAWLVRLEELGKQGCTVSVAYGPRGAAGGGREVTMMKAKRYGVPHCNQCGAPTYAGSDGAGAVRPSRSEFLAAAGGVFGWAEDFASRVYDILILGEQPRKPAAACENSGWTKAENEYTCVVCGKSTDNPKMLMDRGLHRYVCSSKCMWDYYR